MVTLHVPLQWSRKAENDITMRRIGGEKEAKYPTFWPGRPSIYHNECPLVADGELLITAHDAIRKITEAQNEVQDALILNHGFVDGRLQSAQENLRNAIALIEILRQRIVGAGEVLEAISGGQS